MAPCETFHSPAKECESSWPRVGRLLLGGPCNTCSAWGIPVFYQTGVQTSYHAAWIFGQSSDCHPQGDFDPFHQEALCSNYWLLLIYLGIYRHVTIQRGLVTRTGPATDWLEYQLILDRPKNWSHLRLAPDSPIGLEACAMQIRCKCGFLPIELL